MEAYELASSERPRKGIWHVVGSVPLLTEMLLLVLDRLQRVALFIILFLDVIIIAAAFICAALLVPREQGMAIGTRHCIEYNSLGGPPREENPWFQSWRIDDDDFVCTRVEPHAQEGNNRDFFRRLFMDGKLHTSFQLPLRYNRSLRPFEAFNRYMKGYISMDMDLYNATGTNQSATVRLRLGGRHGGGRQSGWDQLGRAEVPLDLDACELRTEQAEDGTETKERCVLNQRLFEVASLDHEFYLLNAGVQNMKQPPHSISLLVIYQTRLYTLVCLNIQACFTGLLLLLLFLFLLRVHHVYGALPAGHRLLALLAAALLVWDVPLGYIAGYYDMPWLGLLDAVRLDLFYMAFLCFCLIFVWEQAFIKGARLPARLVVRPLLPLVACCLVLLALDVTQQVLQVSAVFASRPDWIRFCLAALLVLNALYVLSLCVVAGRSWRQGWNRAALPGRYRAAMLLTCLTAAAACVEHAERRESDNEWFWRWTEQRPTGGHLLYIGMLVWYNVFVVTLLILYLPTRPLVELAGPVYDDEQKVPLNGSGTPEPIKRQARADEP